MSDRGAEEFEPSTLTRRVLDWARSHGAETLAEAYDLLDVLEVSNDVPEVLGHDGTVEEARDELGLGVELAGPDADLEPYL